MRMSNRFSRMLGFAGRLATLVLLAFPGAGLFAGEGVSGVWRGALEMGKATQQITFTIRQRGDAFTGTIAIPTDNLNFPIEAGEYDDGYLSLSGVSPVTLPDGSTPKMRFIYEGFLDDSQKEWDGDWRMEIAETKQPTAANGTFKVTRGGAGSTGGTDEEPPQRPTGGTGGGGTPPRQPVAGKANPEAYRVPFTLQEIRDPGFNNELAVTIAVPEGWTFKDHNIVQWTPALYTDPARIIYTLKGPEDEATFEFVSRISYKYNYGVEDTQAWLRQFQAETERRNEENRRRFNLPQMPQMPKPQEIEYKDNTFWDGGIIRKPVSPEDYVKFNLSEDKTISRVQITKSWKPEGIVEELQRALPELNQQFAASVPQGFGLQFKGFTADTALVEYTYFKDGKQYEQQVLLVIVYMRTATRSTLTGNENESAYWTVAPLFSAYALKGKLKDHDLEIATILENSRVNPVWTAKVDYLASETTRKITESQIESQQERMKVMNETSTYIYNAQQETFQNRRDSMQRVMKGMNDVITGTDRVRGDDGKIYAVPTGTFPDRKIPLSEY